MNYFIKWQKSANQFLEVNGTPAEEEVYVILYMLYGIRLSHFFEIPSISNEKRSI